MLRIVWTLDFRVFKDKYSLLSEGDVEENSEHVSEWAQVQVSLPSSHKDLLSSYHCWQVGKGTFKKLYFILIFFVFWGPQPGSA